MTPKNTESEKEDLKRARVDHLPANEPPLEDLTRDEARENRKLERRRPDLGESEEDTSEL